MTKPKNVYLEPSGEDVEEQTQPLEDVSYPEIVPESTASGSVATEAMESDPGSIPLDGSYQEPTNTSSVSVVPEVSGSVSAVAPVNTPLTSEEVAIPEMNGIGPVASGSDYAANLASPESQSPPAEDPGITATALYHASKGIAAGAMLPAYDATLAEMWSKGDPAKQAQFMEEYKKYEALTKSAHPAVAKTFDVAGEMMGQTALMALGPGAGPILKGASFAAKAAYSALYSGMIEAQKATTQDGLGAAPGGAIFGMGTGAVGEGLGRGAIKAADFTMSKAGYPLIASILGPRNLQTLRKYLARGESIENNTLIQDSEGRPTLANIVNEVESSGRVLTSVKSSMKDSARAFKENLARAKESLIGRKNIDAVAAEGEIRDFTAELKKSVSAGSREAYDYLESTGETFLAKDIVKMFSSARDKFKGSMSREKDLAYSSAGDYISRFKQLSGYERQVEQQTGTTVFGEPILTLKTVVDDQAVVPAETIKSFIMDLDKDAGVGAFYAAMRKGDYAPQSAEAATALRESLDGLLKRDETYAKMMEPVAEARRLHSVLIENGFGEEGGALGAILNLGKVQKTVVLQKIKELDDKMGGKIMPQLTKIIEYNTASQNKTLWRNLPEILATRDKAVAELRQSVMMAGAENPQLAQMILSDIDSKSTGEILEDTIDAILRDHQAKWGSSPALKDPEQTLKTLIFAKDGEKILARKKASIMSSLVGREPGAYGQAADDYGVLRAFRGEATAGSRTPNIIAQMFEKTVPGIVRGPLAALIDVFGPNGTRLIMRATAERGYARSMMRDIGLPVAVRNTLAKEFYPDTKEFVIRKGDQYYNEMLQSLKMDKDVIPSMKIKAMRILDGFVVPDIWGSIEQEQQRPQFPKGPAIDQLVNTMGG